MTRSFFARRSRIPGLSNGLLIMMIVCFLVPFALRGSKMVTQRMENDIKDWLPEEFEETRQLNWFVDLFGGGLIVITWEGCSEEDPSYQLFVDKLKAGDPPIWTRVREGEDFIVIHAFGLAEGEDKIVGERIAALFGR